LVNLLLSTACGNQAARRKLSDRKLVKMEDTATAAFRFAGGDSHISGSKARKVVELILAIYKSAEERKAVKLG